MFLTRHLERTVCTEFGSGYSEKTVFDGWREDVRVLDPPIEGNLGVHFIDILTARTSTSRERNLQFLGWYDDVFCDRNVFHDGAVSLKYRVTLKCLVF